MPQPRPKERRWQQGMAYRHARLAEGNVRPVGMPGPGKRLKC